MLPIIQHDHIPEDVRAKLQPEESIHHFAYIDAKGGCAKLQTAKQWMLVTDRRILFEAAVKDTGSSRFAHQSGTIPISKVSYVGIASKEQPQGCAQVKTTSLRINSSGGEIVLAIPTKEEAERAQSIIDAIVSG